MNTFENEEIFQNEDKSTTDLYGLTDHHYRSEMEQMCEMNNPLYSSSDVVSNQHCFLPVPMNEYGKDVGSQTEDTSAVNFYDLKNFQDQHEVEQIYEVDEPDRNRGTAKEELSFELISQYFYGTIKQAAIELGVGVQKLQNRCRDLGIKRWPGKTLRSMKYFHENAQKLGRDSSLAEKEMKKLEKMPDLPLEQRTLRLRCNYSKTLGKRKSKVVGSSKIHKN